MQSNTYLQSAFEAICKDAIKAEGCYVSLIETTSYYGGPEEGGWWGHDHIVVAYQQVLNEDIASHIKEKIEKLAKELTEQARREFGNQCLREMDWLEERGLDADFLPEPDGPSCFHVTVTDTLPTNHYGSRHYE